VQEPLHAGTDALGPASRATPMRGGSSELVQVSGGVIIKTQRARERFENLLRGMLFTALLKPDVVIDADTSKHRELLAAQTRHTTAPKVRQAYIRGQQQRAPSAQELTDPVLSIHRPTP
jgi:hypothetical protein